MANSFDTDIIIETPDPAAAARFYFETLGFAVDEANNDLTTIRGPNINFYIERATKPLGPVFEVRVDDVEAAKKRLIAQGCTVIKDEPQVPRCYIRDPFGLTYNLRRK